MAEGETPESRLGEGERQSEGAGEAEHRHEVADADPGAPLLFGEHCAR